MRVQCPQCGHDIVVYGLGRKPLDITVKNVCDALNKCYNIVAAAKELGCSRAYIYRVLKEKSLNIKNCKKDEAECGKN